MAQSRLLYGSTIFLSAFLLFMVEPMAAKELLPALGGSSAVWITCLVFFQLTLLFGYLYAHWLTRRADPTTARQLHPYLLFLSITAVFATLHFRLTLAGGAAHPVRTIFASLTLSVGLPLLLLASTSPLLQVWLSRETTGPVPYRLFAVSNAGSLLALALYPTVVEPYLTLHLQRTVWAAGFVMYALLAMRITSRTSSPSASTLEIPAEPTTPSTLRSRLLWFLLPMVAAMQLSAITGHITQNIAAIPLLWTIPLAVYLLTFILAFEAPRLYHRGLVVRFLIVMLAGLAYALSKIDMALPIGLAIAFYLIEAFLACWFLHAETYALRPRRASEATSFYLLIAAGGVAGSFFIGIASPLLFRANYDLPITFLMTSIAGLLIVWPAIKSSHWKEMWPQRLLWTVCSGLLFALIVVLHHTYGRQSLMQSRNFYGSLRVKQVDTPALLQPVRVLLNGSIEHGTQSFAAGMSRVPTTYYAEASGAGLALRLCCGAGSTQSPRKIGVVGLGAGTLAAYAHQGDDLRFYEINPLVRPVAESLFTYLREARAAGATISFSDGDARASLASEPTRRFNVLIVDAFSGDAVPLHLLTTQAMQVYRRNLAPGGIIAFHVSNQYVDLAPEIALLAAASGFQSRKIESPANDAVGAYLSEWVLVTGNVRFLGLAEIKTASEPVAPVAGFDAWTDDYSSLLPVIRWGRH